ncbi:MAG: hypothetical protein SGPRY_003841 [Prymnesium sp.]
MLASPPSTAQEAKASLYSALEDAEYEPSSPSVLAAIDSLSPFSAEDQVESLWQGRWEVLSKPDFPDSLGTDGKGRYMFTLGRASFNMYQPVKLPIALDAIRNDVLPSAEGTLSYGLEIPFETAGEEGKPMSGVMFNYGECWKDEEVEGRYGVKFTGGSMRPAARTTVEEWLTVFGQQDQRDMGVGARVATWVAKRLFQLRRPSGAGEGGTIAFSMAKAPAGYLDILYLDDELRITKGNRGSIVIAKRTAEQSA